MKGDSNDDYDNDNNDCDNEIDNDDDVNNDDDVDASIICTCSSRQGDGQLGWPDPQGARPPLVSRVEHGGMHPCPPSQIKDRVW